MPNRSGAPRIAVFDPILERFNLWISALCLPVVLLEMLYPTKLAHIAAWPMRFLVGFAMISGTHTIFTFIMLALMPELRSWARTRIRSVRITRGALAYLGLGLIFAYAYFSQKEPMAKGNTSWLGLLFSVMLYLRANHQIGQVRGIASLYNAKARKELNFTAQESARFALLEKVERALLQGTAACMTLTIILRQYQLSYHFVNTVFFGALLMGIAIVLLNLFVPRASASNKPWFMFRVLYVVIGIVYTPLGLCYAIARCLHGVEYLGITWNMTARSKWRVSTIQAMAMFLSAGVALYFLRDILLIDPRNWTDAVSNRPALKMFFALNFLREIGHYYLDAMLFRFRDPVVREHVGPLLFDGSPAVKRMSEASHSAA